MALLDTEGFLSQTGKVTMGLARLLLHYSKGQKLPRMIDFARKLKSGNGTIQEAFNCLAKPGAIVVEAHGAQGSHLAEIDYPLFCGIMQAMSGLSAPCLYPTPYAMKVSRQLYMLS